MVRPRGRIPRPGQGEAPPEVDLEPQLVLLASSAPDRLDFGVRLGEGPPFLAGTLPGTFEPVVWSTTDGRVLTHAEAWAQVASLALQLALRGEAAEAPPVGPGDDLAQAWRAGFRVASGVVGRLLEGHPEMRHIQLELDFLLRQGPGGKLPPG